MVAIIDYGMGNLGSVENMVKKLKGEVIITSSKAEIYKSTKIILPGVGSFDKAMQNLKKLDLIGLINNEVLERKKPILGICLGMQLLTKARVPHMGWNTVDSKKKNIFFQSDMEYRYYFVHSYAVTCNDKKDILTTTCYDKEFVSSFSRNNIVGAQFHPEKSHKFGKLFFSAFLNDFNA